MRIDPARIRRLAWPMGETPQIAVIGAGPAGASAALRFAKLGLRVLLVDEKPHAGGRAFPPPRPEDPFDAPDYRGQALRRGLREHPALIEYRASCLATSLKPDLTLTVQDKRTTQEESFQARVVVIATGGHDVKLAIPGFDHPGVFSLDDGEGLQGAIEAQPRARIALGGSGPLLWTVAADLLKSRRNVVAVVDAAAAPTWRQVWRMARQPGLLEQGLGWTRAVWSSRAELHRSSAIERIRDDHGACIVEIAPLNADWEPAAGPRKTVAADFVVFGAGMFPDVRLTKMAGAAVTENGPAGFPARPQRSAEMETSIPGLFVVGDAGRTAGLDCALAEATIAAAAVARRFGRGDDPEILAAEREARARLAKLEPFLEAVADWSRYRPGLYALQDSR